MMIASLFLVYAESESQTDQEIVVLTYYSVNPWKS